MGIFLFLFLKIKYLIFWVQVCCSSIDKEWFLVLVDLPLSR